MKKVVLITGGASGLGVAIASTLSPAHSVVILDRRLVDCKRAAKEVKADYIVADITKPAAVTAAIAKVIKKYGRLDVVINNAGIWAEGKLESNDFVTIAKVIQVNTLGTMYVTRAVVPQLKKQASGLIINVISQAGIQAKTDRSVYYASKWAITGFTKCLQKELGESGVRVIGLYPGKMHTPLFSRAGFPKKLTNAIDPRETARLVNFIVDSPDTVNFPELGICHQND